jgi:hypothetical protein
VETLVVGIALVALGVAVTQNQIELAVEVGLDRLYRLVGLLIH